MHLLFWGSAFVIVYVYLGYPLLLRAVAGLRPPRGDEASTSDAPRTWPGISVVIAARNEGQRVASRLDNLFAVAYPGPREVIVVSDGSTDTTLSVLAEYGRGVEVIALPAGGKAIALNAGVARARHPIVVFADARQTFADDTLVELARPFADAQLGAVTGELLLDCESPERRHAERRIGAAAPNVDRRSGSERRTLASTIADGIGLYWRYEKTLRRLESQIGSTLGATGAVYAMRRELWTPLPAETILDDVLAPMRLVLAGRRVTFTSRARAFDRAARNAEAERHRKVRTLAGNYQILWLEPRLLFPWTNPVWWQYVSHKLGRLVVPYAMLGLLIASVALAADSIWYAGALAAQCGLYLLAGYGAWLDARGAATRGEAARVMAVTHG
jgi:poly-beta-1,6-N-acetyl-D-glucosamine synthase